MGKDSGGGGGETVQTTVPWGPQQPYLQDVFRQAQSQYQGLPTRSYPGQTFAPMTSLEQSGLREQLARGTSPGAYQFGDIGQQTAINMMQAPNLEKNPYIQDYAKSIGGRVTEDLMEKVMPSITSRAIGAGQLGSSRQGLAQGEAIGEAAQAIADANAQLMSQAYGQGLAQQARGLSMAPQAWQMGDLPSQVQQAVGGRLRGEQERYLQDDINRFYDAMGFPRQDLANYMNAIQGGYGSTTTTSAGGGDSRGGLGGAIGGGLTGLGLSGVSPGALGFALSEGGIGGLGSLAASNPMMMPLMIGGGLLGGLF